VRIWNVLKALYSINSAHSVRKGEKSCDRPNELILDADWLPGRQTSLAAAGGAGGASAMIDDFVKGRVKDRAQITDLR
jgi:hypothetical protein